MRFFSVSCRTSQISMRTFFVFPISFPLLQHYLLSLLPFMLLTLKSGLSMPPVVVCTKYHYTFLPSQSARTSSKRCTQRGGEHYNKKHAGNIAHYTNEHTSHLQFRIIRLWIGRVFRTRLRRPPLPKSGRAGHSWGRERAHHLFGERGDIRVLHLTARLVQKKSLPFLLHGHREEQIVGGIFLLTTTTMGCLSDACPSLPTIVYLPLSLSLSLSFPSSSTLYLPGKCHV